MACLSSSRTRRGCWLGVAGVCVLSWATSSAAQTTASDAEQERLPEFRWLRLQRPAFFLREPVLTEPAPLLELSIETLRIPAFGSAILSIIEHDQASLLSRHPLSAELPPAFDALTEFRGEKLLWRLGPLGAFGLQEQLSRAEACFEVAGPCQAEGGWRSAFELRLDVGEVVGTQGAYVMRAEWLAVKNAGGGTTALPRFFQGFRGKF